MNLRSHLLKESSRKIWLEVVAYIDQDENRFKELIDLFFNGDNRTIQRASQPIGMVAEKNPHLIMPYLPRLTAYLQTNPIDAVKRNTMRIFQYIDIPEEIEGELFDIGMNYLKSIEIAIAIKVFSMTVLRKICEKYPELAQELQFQLEILVKEDTSPGIQSRGRLELKKVARLLDC